MDLKDFRAAFDAMPKEADGEDLSDFLAGVAVSFMPPEDAVRILLQAVNTVVEYNEFVNEQAENGDTECDCPTCTAARDRVVKH